MDRWFVVIVEILGILAGLVAIWWLFEQVRFWKIPNDIQARELKFALELDATPLPKPHKPRKAKEERI